MNNTLYIIPLFKDVKLQSITPPKRIKFKKGVDVKFQTIGVIYVTWIAVIIVGKWIYLLISLVVKTNQFK